MEKFAIGMTLKIVAAVLLLVIVVLELPKYALVVPLALVVVGFAIQLSAFWENNPSKIARRYQKELEAQRKRHATFLNAVRRGRPPEDNRLH